MSRLIRRALGKLKMKEENIHEHSFTKNDFEDDYTLKNSRLDNGDEQHLKTFLGQNKTTGDLVTVKIFSKVGLKPRALIRVRNEFKVLRNLHHPNLCEVFDIYEKESEIYIVSEYISGASLEDRLLDESFDFTENDCKYVLSTLAETLKYCKDQGVVHRNLDPSNIMFSNVNGKNQLKLLNFGWSKQVDKSEIEFKLLETQCGSAMFVAPEIATKSSYNYKCDVWSIGVLMFLMFCGYFPFQVGNKVPRSVLLQHIREGRWGFHPVNVWKDVSDDAKDLVKHLLEKDPEARYTYEQILAHKFLQPSDSSNSTASAPMLVKDSGRFCVTKCA